MARIPIRHGSVVRCDMTGCGERFTTYSEARVAREQARAVGFGRMLARQVFDAEGFALGGGGKKVDLCALHLHAAKNAWEQRKAERAAARKLKREKKSSALAPAPSEPVST